MKQKKLCKKKYQRTEKYKENLDWLSIFDINDFHYRQDLFFPQSRVACEINEIDNTKLSVRRYNKRQITLWLIRL